MADLGFSTIIKKAPAATNMQTSDRLSKMSQVFQRNLNASSPNKVTINTGDNRMLNSEKLIYSDKQDTIPVVIGKKAKSSNKTLFRQGTLSRRDLFKFGQTAHNKSYATPLDFTGERKDEYMQTSSAATKAEKKNILAWEAKEIAGLNFRIRFRRHKPDQEGPSDTAFYFEREDEWKKMMNYLKGIKLLETSQANFGQLLKSLSDRFKDNAVKKFREAIALRALFIKQTAVQKDVLIKQNLLLTQFNMKLLKDFTTQWRSIANIRDKSNKKLEQERIDRRNALELAANKSSLLASLNNRLMTIMGEAWHDKALEKATPTKEDINILFNTLELPASITSPSVRIEVKVLANLPDLLRLNGRLLQGKSREFRLSCVQRANNPKQNVRNWGIIAASGDISEEQKKFVKEAYAASTMNLSRANLEGDKFSLHFEDFPLEHLENVEISVNVLDENRVMKAYHYTSLRGLQPASKKGKNAWLCMSTNEQNIQKLPLLHLKIYSQVARTIQERRQLAGRAVNPAKTADNNLIEDTFYNYSFRVPNVTPERVPLLELLPAPWNIMDPRTRELQGSVQERAKFIQRVKYKLSKHYHETTSRQIARLKKSAYIWAELQDDVMTYFPGRDVEERSELYANEGYISQITGQGGEYEGRTAAGNVVSYLFKRDLWESKAEWRRFYVELERLCKKGILPQNRLDIWSEMSRVVYFVKLTEDHGLTDLQKQGSGLNRNAALNPEDDALIRSRKVYNILKEDSQKNCSIFYQNLEDDIRELRKSFGVSKLPYEHNIRHICRAFIYWAKIFSDPAKDPRSQYFVTYSRTVATLCHGFLVCQTCSFVEGNTGVEEHQIFWLLISLVTYILSSYFETNEKSAQVDTLTFKKEDLTRRRNTLTNSALRCNQVKGIKSDLLLLKVLLKDYQPEIHEKFEELGLPLEYYFGDYMLSLFFNLFNPGLTFRIWDILFFEGSSANQVKCNRMIVCVIYTLLQECKQQILQAREGADIRFIIEMYAKFQTSYGDFLRKCYEFCNVNLEQTVPNSETVLGKLNLIRYAFFSDEYNKLDNQTQKFEKIIENYYQQTIAQNVELYKFARQEYQYRPGGDHEIMSYPILAGIIQSFIASYGNPNAVNQQNIQVSEAARKLLKEGPVGVWIKVYSTTSPIEDVRKTALNVSYGSQQLTKRDYNPLSVDLEGMFTTRDLASGAGRELKVEILDERDPSRPKRIKFATIDLKTIPVNVVTKLNLRLNEEDPNIYSENFIASEVELAILVETAPEQEAHLKAARKEVETILLRDLEDVHYKDFRIQNIKNSFGNEIRAYEGLDDNTLNTFSVLRRSPAAWKENFVMTADEFADAMRNLAPFWTESEIRSVHRSITKASRNSVFYITDFFILLILYVKGTLNQKYGLLFDLLTGFDNTSATPEISLHNLKGLASELYDLFMIHIPSNQVDNMIDLAATGHASCIKQVIINEQIESAKVEYPRQVLNKISNFVHLNAFSKDIPVQTAEIIKLLRNIYEKEILPTAEGRRSLQSQNTIDIIYFTDGRNHRLTLYVDQDWKPQEHQSHQHEQAILRLLDCYRNVLPLTTPSTLYNREQFIQILQKLPLINYLSSFENSDSTQTYMLLNEIKFTVLMEDAPLMTVKPSYDPVPPKGSLTNLAGRKREKFEKILRNWPGIARQAGSRTRPSSPSRINKQDVVSIPAGKLDAFLPLSKIIENIKRTVMRNAAENYNNSGSLDTFQNSVYNEHFYTLDYEITIILNKSKRFTNIDPNYTPFLAIMDFVESGSVVNRSQNLEIVFSLKTSRIPDTYREHYNQLAVYRHSDGSSEWLPCKIDFKFQFGQADANIDNTIIDGFGVIFERFPGEVFIKKAAEVIVSQQVDMDELLLKRIDKTTWRAVTVDQIARNLDKSATFKRQNDPNVRNQQQSQQAYPQNQNQFDDPLNRNAQTSQKSIW